MLDLYEVQNEAWEYGYSQVQLCDREGVVAFKRLDPSGNGWWQLVRVWWRTGTVGTYLKHPSQGKTQLYRRGIDSLGDLRDLFHNPRKHTDRGYQRKQRASQVARVPCPLCGQEYRGPIGVVGHVEAGNCPNCPGRDNGRQAVHTFMSAADTSRSFTIQQPLRLEYGDGGSGGWQATGNNYQCGVCFRGFNALQSLMQHKVSRPQCNTQGQGGGLPQLSFY